MGDSTGRLNWRIGSESLDLAAAGPLRDAVTAADHWFTVLGSIVNATLSQDLTLEVVTGDDDGVLTDVVAPGTTRIVLPRSMVDTEQLRVSLLDSVLAVVAAAAETAGRTSEIWKRPDDYADDDEDNLAVELDSLEPEDVLLAGRLDGTAVDELARFHQLDDYVVERVDASGVAEVTDTEAGCASVSWQMRLTDC
ncbi:hypothetical protein [Micromonospora sp. NPDC049204]|uniref:hypothetical protein n=1 Tax=unclassified Micromonospora TaxID=2617518 RepID=UPI0033C30256